MASLLLQPALRLHWPLHQCFTGWEKMEQIAVHFLLWFSNFAKRVREKKIWKKSLEYGLWLLNDCAWKRLSTDCLHTGTRGAAVVLFFCAWLRVIGACKMIVVVLVLSSPRKRIRWGNCSSFSSQKTKPFRYSNNFILFEVIGGICGSQVTDNLTQRGLSKKGTY